MYHPGKVIQVFKNGKNTIGDSTVQAMLEMWDDNVITVLVENTLGSKVNKDDVVLVDYRPMANHSVPKMTVSKILRGTIAKDTWNKYREYHTKRRGDKLIMPKIKGIENISKDQSYVG